MQFCIWTDGSSKSWGQLRVGTELKDTKRHSWAPWPWTGTMTAMYWIFYKTEEIDERDGKKKSLLI